MRIEYNTAVEAIISVEGADLSPFASLLGISSSNKAGCISANTPTQFGLGRCSAWKTNLHSQHYLLNPLQPCLLDQISLLKLFHSIFVHIQSAALYKLHGLRETLQILFPQLQCSPFFFNVLLSCKPFLSPLLIYASVSQRDVPRDSPSTRSTTVWTGPCFTSSVDPTRRWLSRWPYWTLCGCWPSTATWCSARATTTRTLWPVWLTASFACTAGGEFLSGPSVGGSVVKYCRCPQRLLLFCRVFAMKFFFEFMQSE